MFVSGLLFLIFLLFVVMDHLDSTKNPTDPVNARQEGMRALCEELQLERVTPLDEAPQHAIQRHTERSAKDTGCLRGTYRGREVTLQLNTGPLAETFLEKRTATCITITMTCPELDHALQLHTTKHNPLLLRAEDGVISLENARWNELLPAMFPELGKVAQTRLHQHGQLTTFEVFRGELRALYLLQREDPTRTHETLAALLDDVHHASTALRWDAKTPREETLLALFARSRPGSALRVRLFQRLCAQDDDPTRSETRVVALLHDATASELCRLYEQAPALLTPHIPLLVTRTVARLEDTDDREETADGIDLLLALEPHDALPALPTLAALLERGDLPRIARVPARNLHERLEQLAAAQHTRGGISIVEGSDPAGRISLADE